MRKLALLLLLASCQTVDTHPHYAYKALWCPDKTPDTCVTQGEFLHLTRCLQWLKKWEPSNGGYQACAWMDKDDHYVYVRLQ